MLKAKPLYLILLSLYIVIVPFTSNLGQINPALSIRPFVAIVFVSFLFSGILYLINHDWYRSTYLSFLICFCFLFFGHLINIVYILFNIEIGLTRALQISAVWLALFIFLALQRFWILLKSHINITYFLNIFMVVLTLPPVGQAIYYYARNTMLTSKPIDPLSSNYNPNNNSTPDIYILIMDTYGRQDVLKNIYNVDNSEFLNFLSEKGFYIAEQSRSNSLITSNSIASLLNYDYPPEVNLNAETPDIAYSSKQLIMNNNLFRYLHEKGYTIVALQSGFYITEFPNADIYYESHSGLNDLESIIYSNSIMGKIIRTDANYQEHSRRILRTFEQLQEVPDIPGPKLVISHILLPHPPFIFGPDGTITTPDYPFSIDDNTDYPGTDEEYLVGYKNQVLFTNMMLEQTIEAILEKSSNQPIIIIQGDHGPGLYYSAWSADKTCFWERAGILNAYLLPEDKNNLLYPTISPVNSFRIILNEVFGENFEILEDKTIYASYKNSRLMRDITSDVDTKLNCPLP